MDIIATTLTEIWETSRQNKYTWMLPSVLAFGFVVLVLAAWIKKSDLRRVVKIFAFLGLSYLAMEASYWQIAEKWQIRHDWGEQNQALLSERDKNALIADGANLLMGPVLVGGKWALLVFGAALVVSSCIVRGRSENSSAED